MGQRHYRAFTLILIGMCLVIILQFYSFVRLPKMQEMQSASPEIVAIYRHSDKNELDLFSSIKHLQSEIPELEIWILVDENLHQNKPIFSFGSKVKTIMVDFVEGGLDAEAKDLNKFDYVFLLPGTVRFSKQSLYSTIDLYWSKTTTTKSIAALVVTLAGYENRILCSDLSLKTTNKTRYAYLSTGPQNCTESCCFCDFLLESESQVLLMKRSHLTSVSNPWLPDPALSLQLYLHKARSTLLCSESSIPNSAKYSQRKQMKNNVEKRKELIDLFEKFDLNLVF